MLLSLSWLLTLTMQLSILLIYSCRRCLIYMAIKSAMPVVARQFSELPIAFYACLVRLSNIRLILSNSIQHGIPCIKLCEM